MGRTMDVTTRSCFLFGMVEYRGHAFQPPASRYGDVLRQVPRGYAFHFVDMRFDCIGC